MVMKTKPPIDVWTHASPGVGSVNTHIVTTDRGVVVIDAQRRLGEARAVVEQIRARKKPIAAILITHEHPDHVGGLEVFQNEAPGVPIYASARTIEAMKSDTRGYLALTKQYLQDDYASSVVIPTHPVRADEVIVVDGTALRVHDFGVGEASSMTALSVEGEHVFFAADLVAHRMSAFVLEGHVTPWIQDLRHLERSLEPETIIYPGHGVAGRAKELLRDQLEYLESFVGFVREALGQDVTLDARARDFVIHAMTARYGDYPPVAELPALLEASVDAITNELRETRPARRDHGALR